ncbi:hypothetical protein Fmac_019829 [Flemingia macrophylla]|uniref:Hydroxyproline-rich glycoprotein family protein n=1 Tax=Flemingia macrophylla TaxID=520843 RepID=A0ABD1M8Z2_9FABA
MEEEEATRPPFWTENGDRRRLRRSYSLFLSSGALVVCILVIALAFTLVLIPTLHSFVTNILRPNSVKKSWDSLNLLLIVFAILCGFLSKNTAETESSYDTPPEYDKPTLTPSTPPQWYEDDSDPTPYRSYSRLRSFNSYPDLRQDPPWLTADERWRFYDDTHVNCYRGFDFEEHKVGEEEGVQNVQVVKREVPPPPPAPAPAEMRSDQNKIKKTSATKELLTSLKGKKKRIRRRGNVENAHHSVPNSDSHPQPSSVLHNIFPSKKSKNKKLNSASSPPVSLSKTEPVHGGVATTLTSNKRDDFYGLEENVVVTGNESPWIPIPPPPPPPFKMPAWKFRVLGDYVRIDSISSSSSGLPDLEDEVVESPRSEDCEEAGMLLVYPSPDVDTKADTFIKRFRAGLRMEEKQGIGTSNLRPSTKPKAGPNRA